MKTKLIFFTFLAIAGLSSYTAGQEASPRDPAHPYIAIKTERRRTNVFAPELKELPRITLTAMDHDGKEAAYSGVELAELLKMAGVQFGKDLRGEKMALYLLVEAADGYKAVFALPELDREFTDRPVILADMRDGKPLSPADGPFQIIVPGEKQHGRWVRQVTWLRVMTAPGAQTPSER